MDTAATVAVAGAPASFSSYATESACWQPELAPGHVMEESRGTALGAIASVPLCASGNHVWMETEPNAAVGAVVDALAVDLNQLTPCALAKFDSRSAISFLDSRLPATNGLRL